MIERHWKAIAKAGEADHYEEHLLSGTFPQLSNMEGFIKASILRKEVAGGTEFLIVTVWASLEAIKQFAGENAEIAVVPENVQQMMVTFDKTVSHYEVSANYLPAQE